MKSRKSEIIYSDPVRDIISNPPGRIIRWGTTVIFSVFILLIVLSWIIRYPDIIRAKIEITTKNPPATLLSKITGRIHILYINNGQNVTAGQLLAVMETAASADEVLMLEAKLDSITSPENVPYGKFPRFTELGELQEYYASFVKTVSDYNTFIKNDFYGSRIRSAENEIAGIEGFIGQLNSKKNLSAENLDLERRKFERDSALFAARSLSELDFERSKQSFIRAETEYQQVQLDRSGKVIELAGKRQLLQDYIITRREENEKLFTLLNESFMNLKARLRIWKIDYLLMAPCDGTVTFTKYWSENQVVTEGEPVMYVIPANAGEIVGRINLGMQRSGKVQTGYAVNIKLSSFPHLEYGMVRGFVKSKSLVPSGNDYIIEISLPDTLTTLYGKRLEFTQNMQGTAEIITEDIRLIQKIINPFRYLISKNRKTEAEPVHFPE